ncbi:MAG TPA: Nramp family divalent metal transporter, partial [Planctomycetaceae bacterium]|nr:Nramp family divalent metal transporter [Planctomycetaceae bacterium]
AVGWSSAGTWREILGGFFEFGNVPVKTAADADTAAAEAASGLQPGQVVNAFAYVAQTGRLPDIDWSLIAFLSALVAISGAGGLSNTPISNYTRDQGWGMGHHVGAIPSVVGGQDLQLSHVGTVFVPSEQSLPRWKRWYKHVARDQLVVWMPACFLGLALPCMLSVEFLPRGTSADEWTAAAMTADAVRDRVGGGLGAWFWFMTLFCGFLVLAPSMASSADGFIRRWVDVFWTASPRLRRVDPKNIRYVYFGVLVIYAAFGLFMLSREKPTDLLTIATTIFNFALGFSCWHTLAVNVLLLPRELRPNWLLRIGMLLAGAYFLLVASVAAAYKLGYL